MTSIVDATLFMAAIRIMTPILLAALGGLLCWRASVFNIGLEGGMLAGSFFAILVYDRTGNIWLGLAGGAASGMVLSLIFGLAVLYFRANEIVAGIAINLMAFGLTTFLLRSIFGASGVYRPMHLEGIPPVNLPLLRDIPVLGPVLNGHTPMVYVGFAMVIVTYLLLFKTSIGLAIRSVGEFPEAARTAGISPRQVKLFTIIWSGALCGLAGAHLSTGYVFEFSENMVQGRGFTAVTAIVFGASHPIWTFLASFLFGLSDALAFRLQLERFGMPPEILRMFPYILAIVVLTITSAVQKRKLQVEG